MGILPTFFHSPAAGRRRSDKETIMSNIHLGFTASTSADPTHGLGDRITTPDGKEYLYVKATATIAQYDVVTFDETYSTVVAGVSTANDARGDRIGVAPAAITSGEYGWLQVFGVATMNVKASCAANVRLNTTATAGFPDDDGTAGSMQIEGAYLTTARAASDGSAPGVLNYPIIGVTL